MSDNQKIKNELKVFLDDIDVANLFFADECSSSKNFNNRWLAYGG